MSTETRLAFAYRFKELEAEKAKERQGAGNDLVESDTNIRLPVTLSGNPKITTLVNQFTQVQKDEVFKK